MFWYNYTYTASIRKGKFRDNYLLNFKYFSLIIIHSRRAWSTEHVCNKINDSSKIYSELILRKQFSGQFKCNAIILRHRQFSWTALTFIGKIARILWDMEMPSVAIHIWENLSFFRSSKRRLLAQNSHSPQKLLFRFNTYIHTYVYC